MMFNLKVSEFICDTIVALQANKVPFANIK